MRLLAVWAALLAGGTVAGLVVEGNGFDGAVVRWVAAQRTGTLDADIRIATELGGTWLDVAGTVAVLALLLARRRRDAIVVLLAGVGASLLSTAIKLVLGRPRPAAEHLVSVASSSWPSGHALSSIAIFGAVAAVGPTHLRVGVRVAAVAVLTGLAGLSRVYLGVHYPTDVLAGWLLGGLWLAGVLTVVGRSLERDPRGRERPLGPDDPLGDGRLGDEEGPGRSRRP